MYINNLGHMTKMAAMPIYGKNPSKIFFSETNRLISRKLAMKHRWLKYSYVSQVSVYRTIGPLVSFQLYILLNSTSFMII